MAGKEWSLRNVSIHYRPYFLYGFYIHNGPETYTQHTTLYIHFVSLVYHIDPPPIHSFNIISITKTFDWR